MCFGKKPDPVETAAAPAPPLPAPDVPVIGQSRRDETRAAYGQDAPDYRVKRGAKKPTVTPTGPIQM